MRSSPATLRVAAVVEGAESALVLAGAALSAVDTATGQSYRLGSGIALTAIGAVCAAALAVIAVGLAGARRWSRTPALLTQAFFGIVGIYLLQGSQFGWGAPTVTLAVAGFAALLAPASLRAFADERPAPPGASPPRR